MTPYYQDDLVTIYHGDCREILPTLEPGSVDLVLTDPPYGHNNNNNGDLIARREAALGVGTYTPGITDRPIANDGPEANALVRWMFGEAARVLRPGHCCCCCCCGGGPDPQFARWSLWMDEAIGFKMCVVWDKGGLGMGWHYRRCWECVLVGQKPGAKCAWYGGNSIGNVVRGGKILPTATQHPTPKPIWLMGRFITWHTQPGDLVIEPFLGGGTTLLAAKQLCRRAVGIEIEERYCEIAAGRLGALTPAHDDEPLLAMMQEAPE